MTAAEARWRAERTQQLLAEGLDLRLQAAVNALERYPHGW